MTSELMSSVGRLARFPSNKTAKWLILAVWVVVLAVAYKPAGDLTGAQKNDAVSWLPGDAESTQVLKATERFRSSDEITTVVVYERSGGITPADAAAVRGQVTAFEDLPTVRRDAVGPIPSRDGQALEVVVPVDAGDGGWQTVGTAVERMRGLTHDGPTGLRVHFTGPGGYAADSSDAFAGIDGKLLYAAIGVVVVILLLTYRSPLLWILPVFSSVVALMAAQAVVYLLATRADLTVNAQTAGILTVLVFGAGTDYALLLVARYKEELRRHEDRHEAMAFALHRATPAILASAATVAIGMLCLTLAEMNSTAGLGPVLAIGVAVTLLVMITLLPALLVICGRWVFWPKRPAFGSPEPTASGLWAKVGNRIAIRPRTIWVGTAVVLAVACLGLLKLDATGLNSAEQYTKVFDSVKGQQVLTEHGFADDSSPVQVVVNADKADEVAAAMQGIPGLGEPNTQIPPVGGVKLITAPVEGDVADQAAFDTIKAVRDKVRAVDGADALVGGTSAIYLDIQKASTRDNWVIIPIVLLVVMLILMVLLRAVLSPVLLIGTVILSFGAALGLSTLLFHGVFTHLFDQGGGFAHADASFPLFVFVFLVALGIDYNIFLMTRVREETQTRGTRAGSLVALRATGGVITSAGLVLAATFAVLASLPLVFLTELGVAVALGVILETLVVRPVLVTALNYDLGGKIWWPSKLDRGHDTPDPGAPEPERESISV
ncbi:MAG TPA: MMPL family transporter [Nocardioides sp.]|uniref:MMPL family transporter n=1 Tax=Nocardioides sp. TaxID=35761 RepID=UPI002E32F584|nr:MMPL family transporter [Nocardioides sp.]HEX5087361.1 MMPL family transporter [Nocardioides sp.]